MSVFEFTDGSVLDDESIDELQMLVKVREPDRLDELPSNFQVIDQKMLGYGDEQEGYIDQKGYFHAQGFSNGGQAIALLEDDGTVSVSFRGTNNATDWGSVTGFPGNNYINGFDEWLESVADFADKNNYEIDFVTGKSLGGACVNMLRDESDKIADGAYDDATYFAVASPLIADNSDNLINFGYSNDYAHEWYEERMVLGGHNQSSVTDNVVYYNGDYSSRFWISFMDMSSHSLNAFNKGVNALQESEFADEMDQDSFVILAETKNINVGRAAGRVGEKGEESYVISVNDANHVIDGTKAADHVEMGGGNDAIKTSAGDDVIYAGKGVDTVRAGSGSDEIFGGGQNDWIDAASGDDLVYGEHGADTILGGKGDDVLYGGQSADEIRGGQDDDVLFGGWGHDTLYGEAGADIFMIEGQSHDVIGDFRLGEDHLRIGERLEDRFDADDLVNKMKETDDGDLLLSFSKKHSVLIENMSFEDLEDYAEDNDLDDWGAVLFG